MEKRKHQRKSVDLEASVESRGHVSIFGRVRDMSIGGIYLVTVSTLPFGSQVEVKIDLTGNGTPFALPAVVRWNGPDGLGLQFGLLGAKETHAIAKHLTSN